MADSSLLVRRSSFVVRRSPFDKKIPPYQRDFYLIVHRDEELFVVSGFLEAVVDEVHGFDRVHIR